MAVTLPQVQVLVDWVNNPIGANAVAGNDFTDISDYLLLVSGVNMSRGRQDNINVVQPGRCTMTLDNSSGRFTPGYSGSPYYPGVVIGRRIQVNVKDETGTYHTRFDGQIAQYNVNDTATGEDTTVSIACSDILAYINRYPELSCWTVQECQYQGTPLLQYLMNEPTGSQGVYDSSGNSGPLLAPATFASPPYNPVSASSVTFYLATPVITYQSGNNPVEGAVEPTSLGTSVSQPQSSPIASPLPSVNFGATITSGSGSGNATCGCSAQFQGLLSTPLTVKAGNAFTLLGWVWPDSSILQDTFMDYSLEILCLANTRTGAMLSIENNDSSGTDTYRGAFYTNYLTADPSETTTNGLSTIGYYLAQGPFMVALVVNGTTGTFYIGGNIYGQGLVLLTDGTTITIPSGTVFNYLTIGGPIGGGNGWIGNISNVCLYGEALTATQLTDLGNFGAQGTQDVASGTAFTHAAIGYTDVPSYWQGTVDTGLSLLDYVDITGSTPSSVMQSIQSVEKGLFFTDAKGRLNFCDRSRRMGAAAPSVTLPAGSYNVGLKPKVTDQYLINYESLQNERGGSGVVAQNATSIAQYGIYPNGSVNSPQTAPWPTWQGGYQLRQVGFPGTSETVNAYNPANVYDAASWDVNTLGQPGMKLAAVTVEMLANTSGQNEYVAPSTLYGLEINTPFAIGQNLPWWPNSPEASELFIEGINESYSTKGSTIAFYTSPAFQSRAWIPGSTAYGQLDVTARVGISEADNADILGVMVQNVPVPDYTTSMNLGAGADGYVGSRDQLGISANLKLRVQPPLLFIAQQNTATTVSYVTSGSAAGAGTWIAWDTTFIDNMSGFGVYPSATIPAYNIMLTGWYEVCATVQFAANSAGNRTIFIMQNQTGEDRVIAPVSCGTVGSSAPTGLTTSAVIFCYLGDALGIVAAQDGAAGGLSTSLTNGGSHMSVRYLGYGTSRN